MNSGDGARRPGRPWSARRISLTFGAILLLYPASALAVDLAGHASGTVIAVDAVGGAALVAATASFVHWLLRRAFASRDRSDAERLALGEQLEAVYRASPVPILIVDAQGTVRLWNPAAERAFGWSAEEAVGRPSPIVDEEHRSEFAEIRARALGGEPIAGAEIRRRRRDGSSIDLLLSTALVPNPGGVPERFVAVLVDDSERQRLLRALRTLSHVNQALVRASREGALLDDVCRVVVDAGYPLAWVGFAERDEARSVRPVAARGATEYLSGITIAWGDEAPGRGPTGTAIRTGIAVTANDLSTAAEFGPWRDRAAAHGFGSSAALPLRDGAGATFGALMMYAPEPDAFDAPEMGLLQELADDLAFGVLALRTREERDRQAEELRRSAGRLSTLHRVDQAILSATTADETVRLVLAYLRRAMSCDRASILFAEPGRRGLLMVDQNLPIDPVDGTVVPVSELGPGPDPTARVIDTLADPMGVMAASIVRGLEAQGIRSGLSAPLVAEGEVLGQLNVLALRPDAFTDDDAEVLREVADQVAIAVRHARLREQIARHAQELEAEVARRTEELREANAELESFAYSVSHDLRAPLRAMQGFSQALLEDYAGQLDAQGVDFAGRIIEAAKRMDLLVLDLLSYSRVTRSELRLDPVDLGRLVADARAAMAEQIAAADAEVSDQLESGGGPVLVLAHAATAQQIVVNLLENALKFVAPGVRPRVRLRTEARGDMVRLWVEDNGIGIAPEHQDRIFEVLERLHGAETYPGTGIGLAIVRRAIERMGGGVGVESRAGEGSRFWVELRAATPEGRGSAVEAP